MVKPLTEIEISQIRKILSEHFSDRTKPLKTRDELDSEFIEDFERDFFNSESPG